MDVGGRYTSDKRRARIYKRTYLGLGGSPTLGNPGAVGLPPNTDMGKDDLDRTDTKFTPKIGVGWKFAPEHNLYAHVLRGLQGRILRSAHGPGGQSQQRDVDREAQGRGAGGGEHLGAGPEVRISRRARTDQPRRVLHGLHQRPDPRIDSRPTTPRATSPASPATSPTPARRRSRASSSRRSRA